MDAEILFEVETPLGFAVRCGKDYWEQKIVSTHPAIAERLNDVKRTLINPDEVRLSRKDSNIYLFYSSDEKRFVCAVARRLNGDGFLVTAYPTDAIKQGTIIWTK